MQQEQLACRWVPHISSTWVLVWVGTLWVLARVMSLFGSSWHGLSRFISAYFLSHNTIHSTSRTLFIRSAEQPPSQPTNMYSEKRVHFTTFNYCARLIFNVDVQNQESCNHQVSKPFVFHPSPVSRAVCTNVRAVFPLSFFSLSKFHSKGK